MCSPRNIHTYPRGGIGFSWGIGGSVRPKNLKECRKLNWNFQRGGGLNAYFISMILPKCDKGDFGSHNLFKRIKRVIFV